MGSFCYVEPTNVAQSSYSSYGNYGESANNRSVSSPPQFILSSYSDKTSVDATEESAGAGGAEKGKGDTYIPSNGIVDAVDKAYDAMYCAGTKDKQLEEVLDSLNENKIIEFLCCWNKYHSAEKGESFMKAFMWDADSEQKVKYGRKIKNLLARRAERAGIYEDLKDKFAKIDSELSSTCYVNNSICYTYDEIIASIAEAEKKENGKPNECHDGFVGAMETCKEYGLLGNTVAVVGGTVYGIVKGIVDLFV